MLRDEGEAYARKLISAGVPVTATRYVGTIRDFVMLNAPAAPSSRRRISCARRSPAKRIRSLSPGALNSTETAMSRTIKFAKAGGPEVLEFIEGQVPTPGPNKVRIKVKAIGINRAEAMWRVDDYIEPVKFPAGLGDEAAGTVDVVGFAVGDKVNVIPSFSLNDYSTYGEVILVPAHAVVRKPKSLSFHRGGFSLDDVRDRLRRARRGREGRQGRLRSHAGGIQQRWPRGDPARQLCGRDDHRADPHLL